VTSSPSSPGDARRPAALPTPVLPARPTLAQGAAGPPGVGGPLRALIRACRPRQWVKNTLVLVAPAVGGVITYPGVLVSTLVAALAFVLASSGVYLVNDVADVERDRAHPVKRNRPVASGALSVPAARVVAVALLVAAPVAAATVRIELAGVVAVYEAAMLAYSVRLKNEPVIELVLLASGFLLRAVAGGTAAAVPLSPWFLIATGFGSLFVAAGKRYAEKVLSDSGSTDEIRPVLAGYTQTYLRFVWTLAAAVLVLTYALWAFTITTDAESAWSIASTVPFLVAILRYAVVVDRGDAGEPEEILANDRVLLAVGVAWAALVLGSVYV
jgi:decaprenyl-phosphate phosphoribosyltransferase